LLAQGREAAQVENCMQGLEADQRQTISLAFFHGLSHSEVASHLGRPLGTIKTHIRRGLMRLKGCLEGAPWN
jgi:RNA polymerase sigma-70 factor, ECF subfamily